MLFSYFLLVLFPFFIPLLGKMNVTVTLGGHGLLHECLHKNEEGTRKAQRHGESSLSSSLCCPSECRRDLAASSEAVVYLLIFITSPSS